MKVTQITKATPVAKVYKKVEEYTDEENGLYIIESQSATWVAHNNQVVMVLGYNGDSRRVVLLQNLTYDWSGGTRVPMRKATAEEVFQISND